MPVCHWGLHLCPPAARYEGALLNRSPATVFDVMGDPAQIQNWYVLAKDTVVDEQTTEDELLSLKSISFYSAR